MSKNTNWVNVELEQTHICRLRNLKKPGALRHWMMSVQLAPTGPLSGWVPVHMWTQSQSGVIKQERDSQKKDTQCVTITFLLYDGYSEDQ